MSAPTPPLIAFAAYGPQEIPILQKITQLLGTTANSLQALSTFQLTTPYKIGLRIGNVTQYWTARGGSDATDVPNGMVRAGDWAVTGVVWYQSFF